MLVSTRFQVLFTPLTGVLFTFPSRYWFTIGCRRVFSLRRWSSRIPTGFLVSRGTWVPDEEGRSFGLQDYHFLWLPFPRYSAKIDLCNSLVPSRRNRVRSRDPAHTTHASYDMCAVWAVPLSLAATQGMAVAFFSSRY